MSAPPRWLAVVVWAAATWATLHAVEVAGAEFGFGVPWPVGASLLPTYVRPLAIWAFAGTVATACAACALLSVGEPTPVRGAAERLRAMSDRSWVLALSATGFALALAVRGWVTTDHSVGLGGAGYGLPWSVPVAPLAWVPPVLVGATTPAVFLVARRWLGSGWARGAAALFATSPMVVLGGGTLFPGTGLAFVAAWGLYAVERAKDAGAPRWIEPLLAALVVLGVGLDGRAGLGLGVALLAAWAWDRRGEQGATRRIAALAVASVVGVATLVGAAAWGVFTWNGPGSGGPVQDHTSSVPGAMAVRVSLESLGWPMGVVPALFAGPSRGRNLAVLLLLGVLVPNLFVADLGPGLYGPERLHAAVVPVVLLVVLGLAALRAYNPSEGWGRVLAAGTVAAVLVTAVGYTPKRVATLTSVLAEASATDAETKPPPREERTSLPELPLLPPFSDPGRPR